MQNSQQLIECPECHHQFNVAETFQQRFKEEMERELQLKKKDLEQKALSKTEELDKREEDLSRQQQEQADLIKQQVQAKEAALRKSLKVELESESARQMDALKTELVERTEKIQDLQEQALELEKLKRKDKERDQEYEIRLEQEKSVAISEMEGKIREQEAERSSMKMAEKDKQMNDLRNELENARRKAEQGSMQLQGEIQELAIEESLRELFPLDDIAEVPKGCRGADTIQGVVNRQLEPIGKIIYESKRTKAFSNGWIEKLKQDQQLVGADIAVLVTETLPEGIERIGEMNGVWICDYTSLKGLALTLRHSLCQVGEAQRAQANKGDKMEMLYTYLTSTEFKMQIEAIVEGFSSMHDGITKERRAMEKLWKEREKQLEKVLKNTIGFYGSVKGIAGSAVPVVPMLELPEVEETVS